ncbi:MAG: hypothetical protein LPK85_02575, partial [Gammaproteobacteria bacterium]|nr:hypothetical protein [Gammaproteobacteria bacterium]
VERGTTLDTEWSGALSNDPAADDFYAGRSIDPAASAVDRFPPQRWTLTYADGRVSNVTAPPLDPENPPNALNYSAGDIANILSAQDGVNASASTMVAIPIDPAFYDLRQGDVIRINGVPFTINDANSDGSFTDDLISSINSSSLIGFNASVNVYPPGSTSVTASRALYITSNQGDNLNIDYIPSEDDPTGSFVMQGGVEARYDPITAANAATYTLNATSTSRLVTGELSFTFDDTIESVEAASFDGVLGEFNPPGSTQILGDAAPQAFARNTFDPTDQRTYNHATSTTVYDSLGNPHVMTNYFVKNASTSEGISQANRWTMYVLIDGLEVGPPTGLDPNINEPTRASYNLVFNDD